MQALIVSLVIGFLFSSCSLVPNTTQSKLNMPKHSHLDHFSVIKYDDLTKDQQELLDAAVKAMDNSYSPYFHFNVGSALRMHDGEIITGTNVENAAGTSICAERSAILRANAMGKRKIKAIAVIGRPEGGQVSEPITPCGFCRQVIFESSQISDTDIELIMSNTAKDKIIISHINTLLPLAFGPKDLGVKLN